MIDFCDTKFLHSKASGLDLNNTFDAIDLTLKIFLPDVFFCGCVLESVGL